MDQKRTKWRLDGYTWVISKIEECIDLDETMPMKFERKRTWGKHLTRNNKYYVQNECEFLTIRIRKTRRRLLMGQNVNENKAMTKVVIAINKKNVNENKAMTKVVIANIFIYISLVHFCKELCTSKGRNTSHFSEYLLLFFGWDLL